MIKVQVIEEKSKLEEYTKSWEELYNSDAHDISTSTGWTQALLNTALSDGDKFILVVLSKFDKVVGIVPLIIRKGRSIFGTHTRHIFPISKLYHIHSDLLIDANNEELSDAFMSAVFTVADKWDVFSFGNFLESNPIYHNIRNYLKMSRINYRTFAEYPSFFIPFGNNFNDYYENKSHKFRYEIERISKRLHSLGNVEYCKAEDVDSRSKAYEYLLHIEENSWKHKQGTAITSKDNQRYFFRELIHHEWDKRRLHLRFLLLNGEPIVYNLALISKNKCYGLKGSFDERFRKLSPTTLLFIRVIEELIQHGIKEYDFSGEPYEWERKWTDKMRWHESLVVYNNTINAKMYLLYDTIFVKKFKFNTCNQGQLTYFNPRYIEP